MELPTARQPGRNALPLWYGEQLIIARRRRVTAGPIDLRPPVRRS
jgi:hypothetical protein